MKHKEIERLKEIDRLREKLGNRNKVTAGEKNLTECMVGRDAECNHPRCPVTEIDVKNGKYCELPLKDYRR